MEILKYFLQLLTIFAVGYLYFNIWYYMFKNIDKCLRTSYTYWCFERFLGDFYYVWISIHAVAVILLFLWAWNLL